MWCRVTTHQLEDALPLHVEVIHLPGLDPPRAEEPTMPDLTVEPHWERGSRCHGYWVGMHRVGFIGFGHARGDASRYGYEWSYDQPIIEAARGSEVTLSAAKRRVEAAHRRYLKAKAQAVAPTVRE